MYHAIAVKANIAPQTIYKLSWPSLSLWQVVSKAYFNLDISQIPNFLNQKLGSSVKYTGLDLMAHESPPKPDHLVPGPRTCVWGAIPSIPLKEKNIICCCNWSSYAISSSKFASEHQGISLVCIFARAKSNATHKHMHDAPDKNNSCLKGFWFWATLSLKQTEENHLDSSSTQSHRLQGTDDPPGLPQCRTQENPHVFEHLLPSSQNGAYWIICLVGNSQRKNAGDFWSCWHDLSRASGFFPPRSAWWWTYP